MSIPSFSYTASELRAMKKDRAKERLQTALRVICSSVKDHVLKRAEDMTNASFQLRPAHSKAEWERAQKQWQMRCQQTQRDSDMRQEHIPPHARSEPVMPTPPLPTTYYTIYGGTNQVQAECTEEFVGMCLTELETLFPECKIEGSLCDTIYTITIDWSEPAAPPPPPPPPVETLLAQLQALQAENAALKQAAPQKADPFEFLALFGGAPAPVTSNA